MPLLLYLLESLTETKTESNREAVITPHAQRERGKVIDRGVHRNVLLSAQMGERASVVLICIITSCYNEVK